MAIYNGGLNIKNVSISISETGNGNAITSLRADGDVITATRGTTFLTGIPNHSHDYLSLSGGTVTGVTTFSSTVNSNNTQTGAVVIRGGLGVAGNIHGTVIYGQAVYGAVANDLADSIPVNEDCILEHGYCYCFDGEKYNKSSKYMDDGIIGIHSDTYGFKMGHEENKKKMDIAVSGFVLAYVDKEYKPGTPLTCTENGYLTEIKKEDKIEYPEKIVATYWKNEPAEEWGTEERKVKVNGRKWVKIK